MRERAFVSELYKYTFGPVQSDVVVLDIEVCFNTGDNYRKKCDLVLLNKASNQIMFVEAKLSDDARMACKSPRNPEVVDQLQHR